MRERNTPPARDLQLESLEDRILFDAVPLVDPDLVSLNGEAATAQVPLFESRETRTEVVFIDLGVQDPERFASDLASRQVDFQFEFLDASTDGLQQIADYLQGRRGIDAVHIISHGNQAELTLGSAVIQGDQLNRYANELRTIGAALSQDADILIYGCNLGRDEAGIRFLRTFAEWTDADVAASDDLTGHQDFGADWNLEVQTGSIESGHGVSERFAADYRAVLTDLYVTKDDLEVEVVPGDLLIYTISYGNVGVSDALDVVITETLAPGTSFDAANSSFGWTETATGSGVFEYHLGTVPINVSGSVEFAVTVESPVLAGIDEITNTVSITDNGTNGPDENPADNFAADSDVLTAAPELYVSQDDGASDVSVGDTLIYTITYGNDGDQSSSNVVVTETLPANTTFDAANSAFGWNENPSSSGVFEFLLGSVPPGISGNLTFAVTVDDQLGAGVNQLLSNVTIVDDGTNGADQNPANNSASNVIDVSAAPEYGIAISDGIASAQPGQRITYEITVANTGNQDGTGVVVSDTYPMSALEIVTASDGGVVDAVGGTIVWNLGDLAAGDAVNLTVTADVKDAAVDVEEFTNVVDVTDDGANGLDVDLNNNSAADTNIVKIDTTGTAAEYSVTKEVDAVSISPGGAMTYTIEITNIGDQTGSDLFVQESFPADAFSTIVAGQGGVVDRDSGTVTWNTASLAAGETITLNVIANAADTFAAGTDLIDSSVSVRDNVTSVVEASASVVVDAAPDLAVISSTSSTVAQDGARVDYVIQYSNNGTQDATVVVVTERLQPGTSFDPVNSSAGWAPRGDGEHVDFVVGDLAAGESHTITYAVIVDDIDVVGEVLENQVEISDDGANGEAEFANNIAEQSISTGTGDAESFSFSLRHLLTSTSTGAYDAAVSGDPLSDASAEEPLDRLSRWGRFLSR